MDDVHFYVFHSEMKICNVLCKFYKSCNTNSIYNFPGIGMHFQCEKEFILAYFYINKIRYTISLKIIDENKFLHSTARNLVLTSATPCWKMSINYTAI